MSLISMGIPQSPELIYFRNFCLQYQVLKPGFGRFPTFEIALLQKKRSPHFTHASKSDVIPYLVSNENIMHGKHLLISKHYDIKIKIYHLKHIL